MNCINHPDVPVAAYCQSCGKALCQECVRAIGGVVYCEPCLTARLNHPGAQPGVHPGAHAGAGIPKSPGATTFVGLPPLEGPNPGLALGLGFIPGVGAMYNGQFVKGFAHVLVFALLCSFASHEDFFGILIPFWIAYQVFDAYQTARARRDGTPLPNPFGLNDLGQRLGLQQHPEGVAQPLAGVPPAGTASNFTAAPPYSAGPYSGTPGPEPAGYTPVGGPQDPYAPPTSAGFVPQAGAPFVPGSGTFGPSGIPVGAVVLIGLGILFLLSSLGIFRDEWLGRTWPLVLIGIGAWLVYRRTREAQGGKGL
jgi:hypothetical protein